MYVIYTGAIVSYFLCEDGDTYHKNLFIEGDLVVSTVSAITQTPSRFALQTIEDCTLIHFPYAKFRELILCNNDLENFYIAYLEKNWVVDKEKREEGIVTKDAKTRYLELIEEHPSLDKRISLHYIASHLGITPTQLSRIRKNINKNS